MLGLFCKWGTDFVFFWGGEVSAEFYMMFFVVFVGMF